MLISTLTNRTMAPKAAGYMQLILQLDERLHLAEACHDSQIVDLAMASEMQAPLARVSASPSSESTWQVTICMPRARESLKI